MAVLSSYTPDYTGDYACPAGWGQGQAFSLAGPATIESVVLRTSKVGTCTSATVGLYSVSEGLPDALLASYTFDPSGWDSTGTEREFVFDVPAAVEVGTYVVALTSNGASLFNTVLIGGVTLGSGAVHQESGVWEVSVGWNPQGIPLVVNGTSSSSPPSKPTTPTPADASGPGVDFSSWTLSWVDGGGATSYDVYVGTAAGVLTRIAEGIGTTSYQIPVGSPWRTTLLGGPIYWRVDAINAEGTTTGDEWSFNPLPAAATTPSPADDATGTVLHTGASWGEAAGATTYDFYIQEDGALLPEVVQGLTEEQLAAIGDYLELEWDTTYLWRVDTVNEFGTTEGTTWQFSTISFAPPLPSWENLPGKTLGPLDGGVEGVDFRWLGTNFGTTVKRLVVAAYNRIWFEEV